MVEGQRDSKELYAIRKCLQQNYKMTITSQGKQKPYIDNTMPSSDTARLYIKPGNAKI